MVVIKKLFSPAITKANFMSSKAAPSTSYEAKKTQEINEGIAKTSFLSADRIRIPNDTPVNRKYINSNASNAKTSLPTSSFELKSAPETGADVKMAPPSSNGVNGEAIVGENNDTEKSSPSSSYELIKASVSKVDGKIVSKLSNGVKIKPVDVGVGKKAPPSRMTSREFKPKLVMLELKTPSPSCKKGGGKKRKLIDIDTKNTERSVIPLPATTPRGKLKKTPESKSGGDGSPPPSTKSNKSLNDNNAEGNVLPSTSMLIGKLKNTPDIKAPEVKKNAKLKKDPEIKRDAKLGITSKVMKNDKLKKTPPMKKDANLKKSPAHIKADIIVSTPLSKKNNGEKEKSVDVDDKNVERDELPPPSTPCGESEKTPEVKKDAEVSSPSSKKKNGEKRKSVDGDIIRAKKSGPPPKPTKPSSKGGGKPPKQPRKSSAKRALPGTKKSRAKRAKQVDNRSTITSTSDAIKTPVNVYDAVLGEAEDLLQAASEAQALGRLKMASAYQLLLHARLVGLGKRFDRATVEESTTSNAKKHATKSAPVSSRASLDTLMAAKKTKEEIPEEIPSTPPTKKLPRLNVRKPNVQELSKFLPEHIELDSAMIEHLARAAIDLHHKRTGRKIQSDTPTPPASNKKLNAKSTVAWTEEEKLQCEELLKEGLSEEVISQRMKSRTEAQVRSYLQNQKQRQSQVRAVEQVFGEETPRKSKGRGRKPPTQAMNTVPNADLNAKKLLSGKLMKHI